MDDIMNEGSNATTTNLDLAFILDCTASMDVYIDHAKENIHLIADEIIHTDNCSLRIGLIEFRDHPPQENTFVTRVHNFTDSIDLARKFISQCTTMGGGDVAESICCGLSDCLNKLEWRDDSVKLAILITDGPPHGLIGVFDDYFPKGCPVDSVHNDPVHVAHKMAERAITLYCAGCEPSLTFYRPFFIPLTLITGGQYIPLDEADSLSNMIIGGSHEEILMEKLMEQVNSEVLKESVRNDRDKKPLDEDELTKKIHFILNSTSNDRKHKRSDQHHSFHARPVQKFNDDMRKMSNLKTLDEFNKYIMDNNVTISPTNFFIDVLDPFPLPSLKNHSNSHVAIDFSKSNKALSGSNSKRRKNNSGSDDDMRNENNRNSSPDNSSPDSNNSNFNNENESSESNSARGASIDNNSSSSSSSSSMHHQSSSASCSSFSYSSSSSLQSNKLSPIQQFSDQNSQSSQSMLSNSSTSRIAHVTQNINIDQARRLVKKSIARNKLNKK